MGNVGCVLLSWFGNYIGNVIILIRNYDDWKISYMFRLFS